MPRQPVDANSNKTTTAEKRNLRMLIDYPKYSTNFSMAERMASGGAIMAGGTTGGAIFYRNSRRSWIW